MPGPGSPASDEPVTCHPRRTRSRQSHWPANPPAPVTSAFFAPTSAVAVAGALPMPREVGVHHHPHELTEAHLRLPAKHALRLRRIRDEQLDLGGTHELLVRLHELAPVEIGIRERFLAELLHGPFLTGADDVVVGLVLLQHAPHRVDVVAGEAPVAVRMQVAEPQFARAAELDARDSVGDFARHELEAAARALVIDRKSTRLNSSHANISYAVF